MLDTRQYDRDVTDLYYNTDISNIATFENRSLMGPVQEKWLYNTLSQSHERGAVWRVLGQQIVFTQLLRDGKYGLDAWDGYKANRNRILDHLYKNQIDNTVILAGDSHANWVSDLAYPNDTTLYSPVTGEGAIGVEFAADTKSAEYVNSSMNLNLQWSEGHYRGFFTLAVDAQRVYTTFYSMKNHIIPNLEGFMIPDFIVEAWANKLNRPVAGGVGKIRAGALKVNGTS
ncbi:alkaline phosphatase [Moniliophthora roreri MCA 2997]|uniref:Alkaline phosphatase n=1 Tax=Moniliophthora roreri (strain MCA 2997) TaxID=1381753 RepID=V2WYY2_MONRO|nr:alkaline phosphatase [Moniliophthora roreri MCA 2997]